MKHILILCLLTSMPLVGSENKRKPAWKDLDELKGWVANGSTKIFMVSDAIAWDDVEALKILYSKVQDDPPLTELTKNNKVILLKPLHVAAQYGSINAIKYYLDKKADINGQTWCEETQFNKRTPAYWASLHQQHNALQLLLEKGGIIKSDLRS